MVEPTQAEPCWTAAREGRPTGGVRWSGCVQRADAGHPGGQGRASHAVHRLAVYAGQGEHTRYLVDFELDALAERVAVAGEALGVAGVGDLIAITDGGNGLEEALQRHLADNL